ncbi:hypothetical protein JW935_08130 [candidate division KSB1 bacterium]|nr:hypothetical protein [candidate division KSB1 bacterium]
MKRFILAVCSVFLFTQLGIGLAQEQETQPPKFGIGIEVADIASYMSGSHILLCYNAAPTFRIEPGLTLRKSSSKDEASSAGIDEETDYTMWMLSVGFFKLNQAGKLVVYYGARVGYQSSTETEKPTGGSGGSEFENTSSGYVIIPTLGGEFFIGKGFSLGGEVQLLYSSSKHESTYSGGGQGADSKSESSASDIYTQGKVYVRFYL